MCLRGRQMGIPNLVPCQPYICFSKAFPNSASPLLTDPQLACLGSLNLSHSPIPNFFGARLSFSDYYCPRSEGPSWVSLSSVPPLLFMQFFLGVSKLAHSGLEDVSWEVENLGALAHQVPPALTSETSQGMHVARHWPPSSPCHIHHMLLFREVF